MKILLSAILTVLLFYSTLGQSTKKKLFFDNNCNQLKDSNYATFIVLCSFVNDSLNSNELVTVYKYPSNIKVSEGYYISISPKIPADGIIKYYFPNGKLKGYSTWKNRRVNGEYRNYYQNGTLWEIGNCINGQISGQYAVYYDNAQLAETGNDKDGYRIGVVKQWDRYGNYLGETPVPYGTKSIDTSIWENSGVCSN